MPTVCARCIHDSFPGGVHGARTNVDRESRASGLGFGLRPAGAAHAEEVGVGVVVQRPRARVDHSAVRACGKQATQRELSVKERERASERIAGQRRATQDAGSRTQGGNAQEASSDQASCKTQEAATSRTG